MEIQKDNKKNNIYFFKFKMGGTSSKKNNNPTSQTLEGYNINPSMLQIETSTYTKINKSFWWGFFPLFLMISTVITLLGIVAGYKWDEFDNFIQHIFIGLFCLTIAILILISIIITLYSIYKQDLKYEDNITTDLSIQAMQTPTAKDLKDSIGDLLHNKLKNKDNIDKESFKDFIYNRTGSERVGEFYNDKLGILLDKQRNAIGTNNEYSYIPGGLDDFIPQRERQKRINLRNELTQSQQEFENTRSNLVDQLKEKNREFENYRKTYYQDIKNAKNRQRQQELTQFPSVENENEYSNSIGLPTRF